VAATAFAAIGHGFCDCSEGLVPKMIAGGELKSFRCGNLIRIKAEAIEEVERRREPR
jgi:hypothetical protein